MAEKMKQEVKVRNHHIDSNGHVNNIFQVKKQAGSNL